eukprot:g3972.t1
MLKAERDREEGGLRVSTWLTNLVESELKKKLTALKPIRRNLFGEALPDEPNKDDEHASSIPDFNFCFARAKYIFIQRFARFKVRFIVKEWERQWRLNEKSIRKAQRKYARERNERRRRFIRWQKKLERKNQLAFFKRKAMERKRSGKLNIPGFHALLKTPGCEHVHVKYWGTLYDKGYYCRECGREMSWSHEDPHQQLGYGAEGSWPPLIDDKAKEDRMLRIYKEDYSVNQTNELFFDFKHGKKAMELDARHGISPLDKTNTPRLRREFQFRRSYNSEMLAWMYKISCMTAVAEKLRLRNFQELLPEKTNQIHTLKLLHREILRQETKQVALDREHTFIAARQKRLERTKKRLKRAKRRLANAEIEFSRCEELFMTSQTYEEDVRRQHEAAKSLMEYVLVARHSSRKSATKQRDRAKLIRAQLVGLRAKISEADTELIRRTYLQPGNIVRTPFGRGKVLDWRRSPEKGDYWPEERPHNFIELQLFWGGKSKGGGRMWIKPDRILEHIRRLQFAENEKMKLAEYETRLFYRTEKENCRKENLAMRKEESTKRWLDDLRATNSSEKLEYAYSLIESEHVAKAALDDPDKKIELEEIALESVEIQVQDRLEERDTWDPDMGEKPEAYGKEDQAQLVQEEILRLGIAHVEEAIKYAKTSCREKYRNMRLEGSAKRALNEIFISLVDNAMRGYCKEVWDESQAARIRAEETSQIIIDIEEELRTKRLESKEAKKKKKAQEKAKGVTQFLKTSSFTENIHEVKLAYEVYRPLSILWRMKAHRVLTMHKALGGEDMSAKHARLSRERREMIRKMKKIWTDRGYDLLDFTVEALEEILRAEAVQLAIELKARKRECSQMEYEEKLTRKFDLWELRVQLRERRAMDLEDMIVQAAMEMEYQMALLSKEKSALEVELEHDTLVSEKLARRAEVKRKMLERINVGREYAQMVREDILAAAERLERRAKEMEEQRLIEQALLGLGEVEAFDRSSLSEMTEETITDSTTDSDIDKNAAAQRKEQEIKDRAEKRVGRATQMKMKVRLMLENASKDITRFDMKEIANHVPENILISYTFASLFRKVKDAPQRHRLLRRMMTENRDYNSPEFRNKGLPGPVKRALKKLEGSALDLKQILALREDLQNYATDLEAEANLLEWQAAKVEENAKWMHLESVIIGNRELKMFHAKFQAENELLLLKAKYDLRKAFLNKRRLKCNQLRVKTFKLEADAQWMTTTVIHSYPTRMATEDIIPRLQTLRFSTMIANMITIAEVGSREKELLTLSDKMGNNTRIIHHKKKEAVRARRERLREERMVTKRSALSRILFPKSRMNSLRLSFEGWMRVIQGDRAIANLYKVRFAILNQNAQLGRWREDLRNDRERRTRGEGYYGDQEMPRPGGQKLSMMQQFQRRSVKCIYCKCSYKEFQNHENACSYHPGKYMLDCPESCPHHGKGMSRPASCMNHYRWRWSCCDAEEDAPFMANGCRRRWHRRTNDLELREKRVELEAKELEEDAVNTKWGMRASISTDRARIQDLKRLHEITKANLDARKFKDRYKMLGKHTHYKQKLLLGAKEKGE